MPTRTFQATDGLPQIHTFGDGPENTRSHWDNLDFESITQFSHGHHARSGGGNDTFNFRNTSNVTNVIVGRIEDFDITRDEIRIDGQVLDFDNLPSNVRVVAFNGGHNDAGSTPQPWLLIETSAGGHIFYALEGARVDMDGNGGSNGQNQEHHFIMPYLLPDFETLPDVQYVDPQNVVPIGYQADGGVIIHDEDGNAADVIAVVEGTSEGDLIAAGLNDDTVRGHGGDDFIWGGSGADVVAGGNGSDEIWGGGGNDLLNGNGDADTVHGGLGDDTLNGGSRADLLYGGAGSDALNGGYGRDTILGGAGDDVIRDTDQTGWWAGDNLFGGGGNDDIRAGGGDDVIGGGYGDDTIHGDSGADRIWGGTGNDVINGGSQGDLVSGGDGDDTLDGGYGQDTVTGGDGDDLMLDNNQSGLWGADWFDGGSGNDEIRAGMGDDTLYGGGGRDELYGGYDDDLLFGGWGADAVNGNRGHDTLNGGHGRDTIDGGGGHDVFIDNEQTGHWGSDLMFGGEGNDTFWIGSGNDTISGQADADTFIFIGNQIENDVVTDYEVGTDALHLDDALWGGGLTESEVINQYATIIDGDVVFDFDGENSVRLEGVGSTSGLVNDLEIV